jgi:hypothetical protein
VIYNAVVPILVDSTLNFDFDVPSILISGLGVNSIYTSLFIQPLSSASSSQNQSQSQYQSQSQTSTTTSTVVVKSSNQIISLETTYDISSKQTDSTSGVFNASSNEHNVILNSGVTVEKRMNQAFYRIFIAISILFYYCIIVNI